MRQIICPQGNPLEYLKQILWDASLTQDRFFAYCDTELINQVRTAAAMVNSRLRSALVFSIPARTASWKQIQFGEANVQLTFTKKKKPRSVECAVCRRVRHRLLQRLAAHTLLEVIPNALTRGLTGRKKSTSCAGSPGVTQVCPSQPSLHHCQITSDSLFAPIQDIRR